MKRSCAWCGKHMGKKEPLNDNGNTYGICVQCMLKYFGIGDDNLVLSQPDGTNKEVTG